MNKKLLRSVGITLLLSLTLTAETSCGLIVFNTGEDTSAEPITESTDTTAPDTTVAENTTVADETTAAPDPSAEARERLSALPDRDLSSTAVIVATVDDTTICPIDSENPVIMARADSKRAVEEKYNTTVIASLTDAASMLNAARQAYNTDMYYADLLAIPQSMLGAFYAEGILANLYSLPHVDFDAPYYDRDINSAAVAGSGLYAISGAANFNPDYLNCVYFNRSIVEQFVGEDLYALVNDGKWTWDKFAEYSKTVDAVDSIHGHGSTAVLEDYIDIAVSSQGLSYVNNTANMVPTVNYLDNSAFTPAKTIVDKLYSLLYTDNSFVSSSAAELRELFLTDTLMFMTDRLYVMEWIANSSVNWGILPLPKYDESQAEYLSPLPDEAPVFCVLKNTASYETSGLILEALNAASFEYVTDAYINERIDYILRDNGSIHMLETICGSATTDFAHMYASGMSNLENATYGAVYKAVTTRSTLDSLYRGYKNAANRTLASKIKVYG
ncbi:MAG: hypothetical protein IJ428_04920 [Clostridia bacterium]|nr:hypothetical protein [Clostridia bacterium]